MAFLGVDPWRWQYFDHEPCPPNVTIPIDDASAWELYPQHRWVYNKLLICESQGLPHGPHGTAPDRYPVFSKPIYNLRGMGTGSRAIASPPEYRETLQPGHMWMPLLTGDHVSSDAALVGGKVVWCRHTTGVARPHGTFDYWTVHAEGMPDLEAALIPWLERYLDGFTGIVNVETIDGTIIECHLRMAEQWLDLNGPSWLTAVVGLYETGRWHFVDQRRAGYSVVLFGAHGIRWHVDHAAATALRNLPGIASIQVTFDDAAPPESHAMPPGGFRLAIINCWDLDAGRRVRTRLNRMFTMDEADAAMSPFDAIAEL